MNSQLVITILGDDRPGLIHIISEALQRYEGSWESSQMANLAGKFAGILLVTLPEAQVDAFKQNLQQISDSDNQLHVYAEPASSGQTNLAYQSEVIQIELLGQDRPGIIDEITQVLAKLQVNIESLETEQREASMAGGHLFFAQIHMRLPEELTQEQLQDELEAISGQLLVDIEFGDTAAS